MAFIHDLHDMMIRMDRALNARIALAEAEVIRLREAGSGGQSRHKFGIKDSRKIYPDKLSDMARWRKWSARALRWTKMESKDLYEALVSAGKSRKEPIVHECEDESVFFWAH